MLNFPLPKINSDWLKTAWSPLTEKRHSPQHIVDTLKQVEAAGIAEVILYFNYGQKPHVLVKEQMERFMRDIAPHFAR